MQVPRTSVEVCVNVEKCARCDWCRDVICPREIIQVPARLIFRMDVLKYKQRNGLRVGEEVSDVVSITGRERKNIEEASHLLSRFGSEPFL